MSKRPIHELLTTSIENLSFLIDASKVIGKPLIIDEKRAIIPITKVSLGFGIGGSEFDNNKKALDNPLLFESSTELYPYGGGSLGGLNMEPIAFLYIDETGPRIVSMEKEEPLFYKALDIFEAALRRGKKEEKK